MSQPTLSEKAAATIEDLELMASLHRTNGDDAAAEEFDDFGMVVRELVAENERLTCRLAEAPALNCFDEIKRLKAENEALRKRIEDMSPFKGAPLTGAITKCLACGGHHFGLGGLPCPNMRITAQADLPETRSGQIGGAMGKGEQP